ncbi:hypothetical protein BVRB_5g099610 [Beta vulgaris subsp. vulgaris]|nr:hypothetical protein BVRB_5g099610 [Beta vulgaris subsp. vulgaris]
MESGSSSKIFNVHSHINHILLILADVMVIFISMFLLVYQSSVRKVPAFQKPQCPSSVAITSAIFNCGLGLVYLGSGVYILCLKLIREEIISPLDDWVVVLLQGLAWLLLGVTLCLKRAFPYTAVLKLYLALAVLLSAFLCIPSLWETVARNDFSVKRILDVLVFPGSVLLLFSTLQECKYAESSFDGSEAGFSRPSKDESEEADDRSTTPFSEAGYLSKLTFWWVNSLMKKGKKKPLEEKDIPRLRKADKAQTCHSAFIEILSKRKRKSPLDSPPILSTLLLCHWRETVIAGFFALTNVLAISVSPLLLLNFVRLAEGKQAFKHEGYVLSVALFLVKSIESLSKRQWYFRMRLIGLQVRSVLCTIIYEKLLKLSSASNTMPVDIMSCVNIDIYRISEFPYWLHHAWATALQLFLAFLIVYYCMGVAAFATAIVIVLAIIGNFPVAKFLQKYQIKFMNDQDKISQALTEAVTTMKVLKLYAWETRFMKVVEGLRNQQYRWLMGVQKVKIYSIVLFWSSPVLAPIASLAVCYFLKIPLETSKVFTYLATIGLIQDPVKYIPDVFGAFIGARVALNRIIKLSVAPQLSSQDCVPKRVWKECRYSIHIKASEISWIASSPRPTLRDIDMMVYPGERVAICGEVGAGKTTLLAAILGEVPYINGVVEGCGKIGYVSQTAWIQTGTIQNNILFGSIMDPIRYHDTLKKCSLLKDIEMLPFGDLTMIGERGVNLSGGQKQRIQLARALYQNADIYLLDDPFSAVDAHTATNLFNLISEGKIIRASYNELLVTSETFRSLVKHDDIIASQNSREVLLNEASTEIPREDRNEHLNANDQLVKQEEREIGDAGIKPHLQYLKHGKALLYFSLSNFMHCLFILGQFAQSCLLATNLRESSSVSRPIVIAVYAAIGFSMIVFLFARTFFLYILSIGVSTSIFSKLLKSLFRAPMSFYDSTPSGRILSRVSSDLSIVDLDIPLKLSLALGSTIYAYFGFAVYVVLAWEVLLVIIPTIYVASVLQDYYTASARELMRIEGITKSLVSNHFAETSTGAMTIRAFGEENQFFLKTLQLLDNNASSSFYGFAANEWCLLYLEIMYAVVISASAFFMTMLPHKENASGFIGIALMYALSMSGNFNLAVQGQCDLANMMVSMERLDQYMHIASEAPEIIDDYRSPPDWPSTGQVEICELKVRYRPNAPLVLRGISCVFEGGHKYGIVGRTGCGKTTLVSTLFRLVEPTEGKIVVDGIDISTIGLHDLRSNFGIIPQDPILFHGSVRFNLDPLSEHSDKDIWEVLGKCQLKEVVQEKPESLDTTVLKDGSNWSMGQRQLFCLGRALLKRRKILVLDEATASIDNATDLIIQKIVCTEFNDSTMITIAHRIPTVMDCNKVLALSDG